MTSSLWLSFLFLAVVGKVMGCGNIVYHTAAPIPGVFPGFPVENSTTYAFCKNNATYNSVIAILGGLVNSTGTAMQVVVIDVANNDGLVVECLTAFNYFGAYTEDDEKSALLVLDVYCLNLIKGPNLPSTKTAIWNYIAKTDVPAYMKFHPTWTFDSTKYVQ